MKHLYSDEIYKYFFHVFYIRGAQAFSSNIYCGFDISIEPHCSYVVYMRISRMAPESSGNICGNMGKYIRVLFY